MDGWMDGRMEGRMDVGSGGRETDGGTSDEQRADPARTPTHLPTNQQRPPFRFRT